MSCLKEVPGEVTQVPPSLNWDEVSIGYNAYSVLKTGRDEWGVFLPLHFKAYGEYKLPVQIYASIPAIAIFGLNNFAVRIIPIIYGTLTVVIMFFLGRKLFENDDIALIAAFLLAISPWHIQLTRASFESSFSVLWVLLGIWFFIKGLADRKWLIWSMITFAISVYTYNSARVFSPIFIAVIVGIYHKTLFSRQRNLTLIAFTVFIALMLPLIPFVFSGEGKARYKLVSVTDDPGLVLRVNENRGKSTLPEPLPRLVHNKVTYTALAVSEHYIAHFSPDFLFISGAPHKQHNVQGIGELYLFQAPFVILGIFWLIKKKYKYRYLLIAWLLVAFIPVSVTNDSIPNALRTVIAAPFYEFITGLGIIVALEKVEKRIFLKWLYIVVLTIATVISFKYYLYRYYVVYPVDYSRDWQYGCQQAVDYIQDNQSKYDKIVFSRTYGEPQMFTLFYLNYDPWKFQNDPRLIRFETYDWVRVLQFDKFYFPDLGDKGTQFADIVKQNPGKKILFIGKQDDFPKDLPSLKIIKFLNGDVAFRIVEVK